MIDLIYALVGLVVLEFVVYRILFGGQPKKAPCFHQRRAPYNSTEGLIPYQSWCLQCGDRLLDSPNGTQPRWEDR